MRWTTLGCVLACLWSLPSAASAQTRSGGETLKTPLGVRQAAMAEAAAGLSGDITALHYNPAVLADSAALAVDTSYTMDVFDSRSANLLVGMPVRWLGKGGVGLSALGVFGPEMDITSLDGSHESRSSEKDIMVSAGYGHHVSKAFAVGVAVKLFHSTLLDEYTATAFLADLGLLYQGLPLPGLSIGAAIQNVGTPIQYIAEGDPAPSALRVGLGYAPSLWQEHGLSAALDGLFSNDEDPVTLLGVAYAWKNQFFLRAGYAFGSPGKSFTLGAGLRLNGLRLDYAFAKSGVGPDVHRIGLGYVFGTVN